MAEEAAELLMEGIDKLVDKHFETGWDKAAAINQRRKEKKKGKSQDNSLEKRSSKDSRENRPSRKSSGNDRDRKPSEDELKQSRSRGSTDNGRRSPKNELKESRSRPSRENDARRSSIVGDDRNDRRARDSRGDSERVSNRGPRREPNPSPADAGQARALRDSDLRRLDRRERGKSADYSDPKSRRQYSDDKQRRRASSYDKYGGGSPTNGGRSR